MEIRIIMFAEPNEGAIHIVRVTRRPGVLIIEGSPESSDLSLRDVEFERIMVVDSDGALHVVRTMRIPGKLFVVKGMPWDIEDFFGLLHDLGM